MDLTELKKLVDTDYENGLIPRREAADDIVFYHVTQWDDDLLSTADLGYRGEFNILAKAVRQVMADLRANPVQVDFQPIDDTREDGADLLDGLYRADDRTNASQEAYTTAIQEALICGVGAWEIYTEYVSIRGDNTHQSIKRRPLHEANNTVFWDSNAKRLDKSDARHVEILTPYSKEAYEDLVEELTGEKEELTPSNFSNPEMSYAFPWAAGDFEWIYVGTIYVKEIVKDKIITLAEPLAGEKVTFYESELLEKIDELQSQGFVIIESKETKRAEVTKYICSGEKILYEAVIAGTEIPVVPIYGERAFVEGMETWQGIVRLAKDPQRLYNFMMSYIADFASRTSRPKPQFFPEQIQGFEQMYNLTGADNNLPFYYINRLTADGQELPAGPAGMMPEQKVPEAVVSLLGLTREAVNDVASTAVTQEFADVDLSGDALAQLNARIDQQSHVYQENMKHAKRRDAEIYVSMAKEIYDTPRKVTVVQPDGTTTTAEIMQATMDEKTGELVVMNDLRNAEFEVYSEIGPTYKSQKDQTRKELTMMLQAMPPQSPMYSLLQLKYLELLDGVDTKDIREYARKQMVLQGFKEPTTPEEEQMVIQQQQMADQPDPNTLLAQAEIMKGQADMLREQREAQKDMAQAENDRMKAAISAYEAETNRFEAQVQAEKYGAEIGLKGADLMTKAYATLRAGVNRGVQ